MAKPNCTLAFLFVAEYEKKLDNMIPNNAMSLMLFHEPNANKAETTEAKT